MKKPGMILFDYGQNLVNEQFFDEIKGTEAVLKYATKNDEVKYKSSINLLKKVRHLNDTIKNRNIIRGTCC